MTFTLWITKYALSTGIKTIESEGPAPKFPEMVGNLSNPLELYHGQGREWHYTEAAAKLRAEEMRLAKIKSLRKQIQKLEKLTF